MTLLLMCFILRGWADACAVSQWFHYRRVWREDTSSSERRQLWLTFLQQYIKPCIRHPQPCITLPRLDRTEPDPGANHSHIHPLKPTTSSSENPSWMNPWTQNLFEGQQTKSFRCAVTTRNHFPDTLSIQHQCWSNNALQVIRLLFSSN